MKLHIGSGRKKLDGWTSVDVRRNVGADIVADARNINLPAKSVEMIYACHVLEHFKKAEVEHVLKHWVRLLRPGGLLYLAVPSFPGLMYAYEATGDLSAILPALFGGQNYLENIHYTTFDYASLTGQMAAAGIKEGGFWYHNPPPPRMGYSVHVQEVYMPTEPHLLTFPRNYYDYSMLTIQGILCSLNVWGKK